MLSQRALLLCASARGFASHARSHLQVPVTLSHLRHRALLACELDHFAKHPSELTLRDYLLQSRVEAEEQLGMTVFDELPRRIARRIYLIRKHLPGAHSQKNVRQLVTSLVQDFNAIRELLPPDETEPAQWTSETPASVAQGKGRREKQPDESKVIVHKSHPSAIEREAALYTVLSSIKRREIYVPENLALGVKDIARRSGISEKQSNQFFDLFFHEQIAGRVLLSHYLALRSSEFENFTKPPFISSSVNIVETVQEAAQDAIRLCEFHMGISPEVIVDTRPSEYGSADELNVTLPFIEEFLSYILTELLKNSLRATVDFQPRDRLKDFPVIVTVTGDEHSAVIRVRDRGGGVPDQQLGRIWSYLYTTAPKSQELGNVRDPELAPLAGYGLGLPLARAHARFCGGKIDLVSLPGHGADAFVQIRRIGL